VRILPENLVENVKKTLEALAGFEQDEMGDAWVSGEQLQGLTGLSPSEINNAVSILRDKGLVEWRQYLGTAPFKFGHVSITARGRFEREQTQKGESTVHEEAVQVIQRPATPVGSPYGFTDQDWETVAEAKSRSNELRIVLGCQFESEHYNTELLKTNVRDMLQKAVEEYNTGPGVIKVSLIFKPLTAGYGEHLFNEIARNIISSDIAVFETSDLNPNVMLEMGVALTWDVRVLPIKKEGQPKPPSDISGQTYADYRNSAAEFTDSDHHNKLLRMVERAARKKGKS